MSAKTPLFLVSVGPGAACLIPPLAQEALEQSDVIIGYELYLHWIEPWIAGKEIHTSPLTQEATRARLALHYARAGKKVSLVSSGDIGVYGMATLVFEEMSEHDIFEPIVVPGISAANSCASLVGAPLAHDFAVLSLSDLLCPWSWIEFRARALAQADLVTALYNVQSRSRREGVYRILDVFLESKNPETWCAIVKNAYREGQSTAVCRLKELSERKFDMTTTIIIGNRYTEAKQQFIYTPRGYNGWSGSDILTQHAIWVFSGTSDGNELAAKITEAGLRVVLSTATQYGRELAVKSLPEATVQAGRMGEEARLNQLRASNASAIVDATHPFATTISAQLIRAAEKLKIPYFRYERPVMQSPFPVISCDSAAEAANIAVQTGKKIFLATGSKDVPIFVNHPEAGSCEWFVRVTPDPVHIEEVLRVGVARDHVIAMQGPFSRDLNRTLWSGWAVDCVVTRESGESGGFLAKAEAAHELGLPLIVIQRPGLDYPWVTADMDLLVNLLIADQRR
ncbi:MAG: precorrin-3B C(17)-methyltransferase [Verrucomicrobia bacterium]|nr:precorrin-3B C(17)-methyltransferase [Verrucomicrobiota bacterium]